MGKTQFWGKGRETTTFCFLVNIVFVQETHEKYFYSTEHWNYFTNDEDLGPVILSLKQVYTGLPTKNDCVKFIPSVSLYS